MHRDTGGHLGAAVVGGVELQGEFDIEDGQHGGTTSDGENRNFEAKAHAAPVALLEGLSSQGFSDDPEGAYGRQHRRHDDESLSTTVALSLSCTWRLLASTRD